MTLKEKLNDSIITNINIVESENRMCYDYNHLELAENCEQIAEDFAIGFAEWKDENYFNQGDDVNEYHKSILEYREGKIFKVKELLEIYKKTL